MSLVELFQQLQKDAESGDVSAQAELAKRYEFGEGTEIDLIQAFYYASLAAENGDLESLNTLAIFYATGKGTDQNIDLANELFEKAAEAGFDKAILNLARMFSEGHYNNKDKLLQYLNTVSKENQKQARKVMKIIANDV